MTNEDLSKTIAYALRHRPEKFGLKLDKAGWVNINTLAQALTTNGKPTTETQIREIARQDNKQRYTIQGNQIRAAQGHSINIQTGHPTKTPPTYLYHGTIAANLPSIQKQGLLKGNRQQVHLSADTKTATQVGARRGTPTILKIAAGDMARNGIPFNQSENGVWLVDTVPPRYITIL